MYRIRTRTAAISGYVVATLCAQLMTACSSEPTTREQVCASFDELGTSLASGNGLFDNPIFSAAEDLSKVAKRYAGDVDLSNNAVALQEVADSDSTSGQDLMIATSEIADLCGYPLGMNALLNDEEP